MLNNGTNAPMVSITGASQHVLSDKVYSANGMTKQDEQTKLKDVDKGFDGKGITMPVTTSIS